MKFGIFCEHQVPRAWGEDADLRVDQEALEQVELADEQIAALRAYGRNILDPGRAQGTGTGLGIPTEDPSAGRGRQRWRTTTT